MKKNTLIALWLAIGYGTPLLAQADDGLMVGVMPSYSEGDYGTSSTTKIEYVPTYFKYQADDLTLKLTVPYISVESAGALVSGGMVIGSKPTSTFSSTSTPAPGGGMVPATSSSSKTTTESGLGDIWLEGRYRLHGTGYAPDFIPYMKVKFGTASLSKGLGTGANDYEGGLGLEWAIGTSTFPFLDAGYRVLGQPSGVNVTLHNIATYDAGVTVKVSDKNFLTGMYAGHQAAISGQADTADLIGSWNHMFNSRAGFQAFIDKGLSNGSPNYAVGVGVETRF